MTRVFQCSPLRSGSTLVYNILRVVLKPAANNSTKHLNNKDKKYIYPKQHHMKYDPEDFYVLTIRHPYNSIISLINVHETEQINDMTLTRQTTDYIKFCHMVLKDLDKPNILVLKYEDFVENYDLIYEELEKFLDITITDKNKDFINREFNRGAVRAKIGRYRSFRQYDPVTHLHGKHISKTDGHTDYRKILSKSQIEFLEKMEVLNKIIDKFGYSETDSNDIQGST